MKAFLTALLLGGAVAVAGQAPSAPSPYDAWTAAVESRKEDQLFSRCHATVMAIDRFLIGPGLHPDFEHFHVTVSKTAGQIGLFFAEARRLYKKTAATDLPENLRTDAVFVNADPHQPASGSAPAPIEHIVLIAKKSGGPVQPLDVKIEPVPWGVAAGGKAAPNRATARFELGQVRELPAGEFDVVLVTTDGERRCKVGERDRQRLFGGR
jgi:hypothetical protein